MSKTSFLEQLREEVDNIQKELGCTEAEAYYALRRICQWNKAGLGNRDLALETIEMALVTLEFSRKAAESGIDSGDPTGILIALHLCAKRGFPFPVWLKKIVVNAVGDYLADRAKSLDDAFGGKRPRHYRQAKANEGFEKSYEIYVRCQELKKEGVKIGEGRKGDGLFEVVAKQYGMSVTKIKDYYYSELESYRNFISSVDLPGISRELAEEFYKGTKSARKSISQCDRGTNPPLGKPTKKLR